MAVLAELTAKRPERGDLHASADPVVLLAELVEMAVFNKRIDNLTGEQTAEYRIQRGCVDLTSEDGKIIEVWDIFDRLWGWQQLGILPDLKSAIAKTRAAMLSQSGDLSTQLSTSRSS